MGLSKYKLGELIEYCDERNKENIYSLEDVKGISIQKIFIDTKADMKDVSLTPYKIVKPDDFSYVTVTSRNGNKITLARNEADKVYIVSSSYEVFRVKETSKLLSKYLFMYFNRPEFDRYSRYNSWGSARETFSWEDMCDIEIELPSIDIQQKYVDIYNAMVANQQCYERGLDDLKLTCDAYIENLRKETGSEPIGKYIEPIKDINIDGKIKRVKGVESSGSFMDTRANMNGVDISKYSIVKKGDIAYNPSRINIGSIALYNNDEPCIMSPMYLSFRIKSRKNIIPEYLSLWFNRKEFQRYTMFNASGSVRDTFDYSMMEEVSIPIPSIDIQQDIVNIYNAYNERKSINEKLKKQIKDICPILIKGSIEEGKLDKGV